MSEWKETDFGKVPISWEISTLGNICQLLTDGSHLSPKPVASDYFMASVKDMRYNRFDFSDCKTVSKNDFDLLIKNNCSPQHGDILLSKDGANCLDIIFVYKQKEEIVLLSSIAIARLKQGYNPNFYRYFLLSPNVQEVMRNNFVSGSAIPRVILKDFRNVPVPLIQYSEQTSIVEVLSSLDDKIDLLHRENKTLEQLAETLFRQWFLEEAEGSWEVGKLGDEIELVYGKALKEETRNGNGFPVVGSSGIVGYHSEYFVEAPGIVIGRKGTLGKVIYLFENFFPIDTTYFIKSKKNSEGLLYEYFLLRSLNFEELNSDSAVPGLNRDIALSTETKIAPLEKIKEFNKQCSPMFQKIKSNTNQIKTLTQLRDILLPKLMSGEIRIANET